MVDAVHPELETPFGRLRGVLADGVAAFRRVPYAEAPVGPQRFRMPGAAPRWHGVRDATASGPIPPQLPSRLDAVMGAYEAEQSEDCLHLDIWTTHKTGDFAPVLVFIHGGAFMTGGGSLPCYDGSVLAKENGVVVVNISYRLGVLGFWPQPDLGGLNLALHDQVAALRWIKEAIASFGGDPERITVIGQSAGAFSIAAHLGIHQGSELFKRAILMSAPLGLTCRTIDQARPTAAMILEVLGLDAKNLEQLRTMPLTRIFDGLQALESRPPAIKGDITPLFMPILDDGILPRQPADSIAIGSAHWCDVMIGVTREEGAAFTLTNTSLDALPEDGLRELFEIRLRDGAEAAIARIRSQRAPATPRTILNDLNTDDFFIKKSLDMAATQSRLGRTAFTYFFDWQSPNPALGACHCIDLPFLFGNIDTWMTAPMLHGADVREVQELSRLYRGAITAFAANGDPNGSGLPRWPAYKSDRAVLHFDRRIQTWNHIA